MASSWSSTSPMRSGRREDEKNSSPIRYREGPLAYEPPVNCKCGLKAARWISWSNGNPGRRYLKCYRARFDGCDFWHWVDERPTEFQRQVLIDLRDTVNELKAEKCAVRKELDAAISKNGAIDKEAGLRSKEIEDLRCKVGYLERENSVYKKVTIVIIVVFVIVVLMIS